eukprot:3043115-Rhodomonas_salina.2
MNTCMCGCVDVCMCRTLVKKAASDTRRRVDSSASVSPFVPGTAISPPSVPGTRISGTRISRSMVPQHPLDQYHMLCAGTGRAVLKK